MKIQADESILEMYRVWIKRKNELPEQSVHEKQRCLYILQTHVFGSSDRTWIDPIKSHWGGKMRWVG